MNATKSKHTPKPRIKTTRKNWIIIDMDLAQTHGKGHRVESITKAIFANDLKRTMECVDGITFRIGDVQEAVSHMRTHISGTTINLHRK